MIKPGTKQSSESAWRLAGCHRKPNETQNTRRGQLPTLTPNQAKEQTTEQKKLCRGPVPKPLRRCYRQDPTKAWQNNHKENWHTSKST